MVVLLAASAVLGILGAAAFAYAGYRTAQREAAGEGQAALTAFVIWWGCTASERLVGSAQITLYLAGVTDLPLFVTGRHVTLLLTCIALWALCTYFAYLIRGNHRLRAPLAIAYGIVFLLGTASYTWSVPKGLAVHSWGVEVAATNTIPPAAAIALLLLLLAPPLIGAGAYLSLYRRIDNPEQRFRILLTSLSFILWLVMGVAARLMVNEGLQFASRGVAGTVTALAVVLAYAPPGWLRRRWARGAQPTLEAAAPLQR